MMKTATFFICSSLLFSACRENAESNQKAVTNDSDHLRELKQPVIQQPASQLPLGTTDTTITYEIEGLSAEGSELVAHYVQDTIKEVTWKMYGETGQSIIKYVFLKDGLVKAQEHNYVYGKSVTEVKHADDMKLRSELRYMIDTSGSVITKIRDKDFVNVFNDMKAHVPFVLRK